MLSMPDWFEVRSVQETQTNTFPVALHRGERQAILLAEVLSVDVLLIDEQIGRTIAPSRNLPLSGTLGVPERTDTMGFVSDFLQVLQRLKASGFFIPGATAPGASSHAASPYNSCPAPKLRMRRILTHVTYYTALLLT